MCGALSFVLAQTPTPDAGAGAAGGGSGLWASVGGLAGLVALAALLFDNGILVTAWNAFNRRYKWDTPPALDPTGKVIARISHGYEQNRTLTMAVVVVPQRLGFRILWRVFHPRTRTYRWIVVANLLGKGVKPELAPHQGVDLQGQLNDPSPLPTWKIWKGIRMQSPAERRLLFLARFDRKSNTIAKRVEKLSGAAQPPGA
jgi:hypothetical protein